MNKTVFFSATKSGDNEATLTMVGFASYAGAGASTRAIQHVLATAPCNPESCEVEGASAVFAAEIRRIIAEEGGADFEVRIGWELETEDYGIGTSLARQFGMRENGTYDHDDCGRPVLRINDDGIYAQMDALGVWIWSNL